MATINRAAKCRLYPNKHQEQKILMTLNCCRYVYNEMLSRNTKVYKRRKEHLFYNDMQNLLPVIKKYKLWLADADSQALKYACRQVDAAFKKFFKHEAKYPKFHSKRGRQSYTTTHGNNIHIADDKRKVKLPCLGWIKVRGLCLPDNAIINHATISRDPDGSFYVSINYKYEADIPSLDSIHAPLILGLDYKSDELYVDSEGVCTDMPHWFRESQARLAKQQRILSRRQGSRKGEKKSSGWKKQHRKVAKLQRKAANQRSNELHLKSKQLANKYDIIGVEDLDMKAMSNKDFGNGKTTMDNGYGMFLTMLDYKLAARGKRLVKVSRWFPSSQMCNHCGAINPELKDLKIRQWICPVCGTHHDRDINAARNIRDEACRLITIQSVA